MEFEGEEARGESRGGFGWVDEELLHAAAALAPHLFALEFAGKTARRKRQVTALQIATVSPLPSRRKVAGALRKSPMKVNYLVVCDGALRTQGKLNLLGLFTVVNVRKLPTQHAFMALVAELNAEPGEHEFWFQFKGSGGEDLAPATPKGKFKVGDVGLGEVVAELRNFPLTKPGFLSVQIVINGKVAGQRDLLVRAEQS